MFYSFILLITILSYINSIYISPYKNNDFNIEIPYANHSKQNINLIFSVSEREIPSGVYFTINFQNLSNFENDDAGTLSKCKLEPYYDYDGDNFNPSSDLIASQSEEYINYISLCTVNGYTYNFKLNHSILIDTPYELSFKMSSAFGNQGKGFLNFFSVSFESSPSSNTSFIYSKNWFFAQFGVRDPISASQNVSLTRKKNYYDKDFFNSINNCLNDSLLSYEEAVSKLSDIGVYSFNEMIRTSNILKFATWDIRSYPNDIIEYPGFLGNFMLEVYVDTDLKSFTLFRIDIPTGWSIENSNCVSLNFTKIFANGTNKKVNSISHSKCKIGEDSQSLTFYNIEPIMKNTYIRINITNVKNPYIPMTGMSKLLIFDENTKIMKIESNELGLLKVATKKNLNITIRNAISNLIPNTTSFLLNTTQQIQMELTLEYYDISAESKIVITQNSSDNSKFGFNEGSCVIVNENWALGTYPLKPILCVVDKSQNTLTINNIAFITADTPFKIFFINSNEEIITQVQFQAEIFVKKLDDSDFSNVASVSNFHNIKMEKKSISLTSVYYEFDNGTKALNLEELPLEQTKLKFEFTMPSIQYSNGNSDYLEIIMNEWINADLQNLLCFVTVNAATNNASCNYTNFDNSAVVSVLLDQYNIFTNTSITLEIQGLSYQRILFNAYKYSFDYYLIYYSKNTNYISVFSANIKPILNENPESSQILIIGQGGNATVTTSIIKIKLSSPNYSYFTNLFRSNSKISIFFKNLQSDQMKNYANCSCFYPEDSGIFSYFVKAINNASDNYLNWNKFEINNISSSYYDNFVEIPFDPNSENPLFYIVYYINTSTSSGSNDYFDFAYDLFKKESKANYTVSTTNVLKIDWDSTANDNDEPLIIRSTRKIMFSIEVSSDVFENLYKNELSGSFVFVFPWLNPKDDSPIFCEFTENYYSTIDNTILNDELADRSLLILYPDLSSLESDTTNGFKDTFSCDYMTIPTAISSPKYISYITSYDGYVLSSSSVASGEYQLIPGHFY